MKTTIEEVINRLNLNDNWILDQFKEWDEDENNDFRFENNQKKKIYKKDIYKIAKKLKSLCNINYNGNIEEFEIEFNNSIENSNDYWDLFQNYIS